MRMNLLPILLLAAAAAPAPAQPQLEKRFPNIVRLREIAHFCGVQNNHLQGMGVVVGLRGTGDSNKATMARLANVMASMNINVDPGQLANGGAALVMVTCEIPPFLAEGSRIDLEVSTMQDAQSLFGGQLLFCTLRHPGAGGKGEVYVVGQGAISTGGFSSNSGGSNITRNHPVTGRVPSGGIIEQSIPMKLVDEQGRLRIRLHDPAADTVNNICRSLRTISGLEQAVEPQDFGTINITLDPLQQKRSNLIPLIAEIQKLPVQVGGASKVIINERTGTVVVGEKIKIGEVTILKGNLTITVTSDQLVSQPPPLSPGETKLIPRTSIDVVEGRDQVMKFKKGAYLSDVVEMMNRMGASPRDIIDILQNLKAEGAIHAQLEII